jgi:hypothetical protein
MVVERRGLTGGACPQRRGLATREEHRQDGVGVADKVRMVREEVHGDTKLGVGSRGQRGTEAACPWWLSDGEQGSGRGQRRCGAVSREGKGERSARRCVPLIAARGSGS